LLVALLVGLAAASVPILASTREHCGDGPRPPEDAPRYLLLASNAVAADLLCGVPAEAIRFERVTSAGAVSQRIEDEAIAGVVFDRAMYETVPGGVPRLWLTTGSGRVIVGLQMTQQEVDLRMQDPPSPVSLLPPEQRGETSDLQGRAYFGYRSIRQRGSGNCGGSGTSYSSPTLLAERLKQFAERCNFGQRG
jgi:hypothetical protein